MVIAYINLLTGEIYHSITVASKADALSVRNSLNTLFRFSNIPAKAEILK